jgi:hypothetical protein
VRAIGSFGSRIALPHPVWRSRLWMAKQPWFETEILPPLRARIADLLAPVGDNETLYRSKTRSGPSHLIR